VHDFVSYVNGYYRLQVNDQSPHPARDGSSDADDGGGGLVVRTLDHRHASSSSSSENGLYRLQLDNRNYFILQKFTTRPLLLLLLLPHPFNGLFSRPTWVSRYQKGKTSLVLNEARDDGLYV